MPKHIEIGKKGERMAVDYLKKRQYKILHLNYRVRHMEIDIIAQDADEIVIVEVKTRQHDFMTDPSAMVSRSKQRLLVKATHHFLHEKAIDLEVRFDVILILLNENNVDLTHIKSAFYAC